ncbi:MAG: multidrug ABC transporter substrate-binding protein [Bacteroidetes bacterium 43-93]|nr:ABC transporter permease [Bacteroidota bacterium]OJX01727.1 MAG: multidrug ABC transporter substrate-binding protein [Bacteroidetes bacterium 43-93]
MKLLNLIKIASRSLSKNKMRVFLTMLGIIIGVASVISMLAIGEGSRQNIEASVSSLGTNTVMIYPGSVNQGGVRMGAGSYSTLTQKDADVLAARCEYLTEVSPVVMRSSQVIAGSQNWHTMVVGGYNSYISIRSLKIESGNLFSSGDQRNAAKVCVIGQTVSTNLFGEGTGPVGQFIRINSIPFRVIGLLEKKGQNTFGQDQDDIIIAPFSTVQKRMLSGMYVNNILASARSEGDMENAKEQVTEILRLQHKLSPDDEDDFTVRSQADIANVFGSISKVLTILLASIASISLLVGGIGIMNIMLVSVTERTREIGIRMAVGAKSRDVLFQFMIESVFISFIGGLIGILFGILVSQLVARFGGWPVVITASSVLLSFAFSAIVGIFFGWYPARKAAGLNPIDALRYE